MGGGNGAGAQNHTGRDILQFAGVRAVRRGSGGLAGYVLRQPDQRMIHRQFRRCAFAPFGQFHPRAVCRCAYCGFNAADIYAPAAAEFDPHSRLRHRHIHRRAMIINHHIEIRKGRVISRIVIGRVKAQFFVNGFHFSHEGNQRPIRVQPFAGGRMRLYAARNGGVFDMAAMPAHRRQRCWFRHHNPLQAKRCGKL